MREKITYFNALANLENWVLISLLAPKDEKEMTIRERGNEKLVGHLTTEDTDLLLSSRRRLSAPSAWFSSLLEIQVQEPEQIPSGETEGLEPSAHVPGTDPMFSGLSPCPRG